MSVRNRSRCGHGAKLAQRRIVWTSIEGTKMRFAVILAVTVGCAACAGTSTAPSSVSAGTTTSVAGTWGGTIASSNNSTEQVTLILTQSGSDIRGTWASTSVSWSGQVTATMNGSAVDGQVTFAGTAERHRLQWHRDGHRHRNRDGDDVDECGRRAWRRVPRTSACRDDHRRSSSVGLTLLQKSEPCRTPA